MAQGVFKYVLSAETMRLSLDRVLVRIVENRLSVERRNDYGKSRNYVQLFLNFS